MVDEHVVINFNDPTEDDFDDGGFSTANTGRINVLVDDDSNPETLEVGINTYLLISRYPDAPYFMYSSNGDINLSATGIPINVIDETITFNGSNLSSLANMPVEGTVSYTWTGNDGGVIAIEGNALSLPDPIVGVAKFSYTYLAERWLLENTTVQDVAVVAVMSGDVSKLLIAEEDATTAISNFYGGGSSGAMADIQNNISDSQLFCGIFGLSSIRLNEVLFNFCWLLK